MSVRSPAGVVAGTCLALLVLLPFGTSAQIRIAQGDGWYRWQTTSLATAADACCHAWRNDIVERCACNLDERHSGMRVDTGMIGDNRLISVYVKMENGSARKIRALDVTCPVNTSTPIADLGTVEAADSIAWLQAQLNSNSGLGEYAINAIGMHGGNAGMRALVAVIEDHSYRRELRERALFWLAQSDSDEAFDYLDGLLSNR